MKPSISRKLESLVERHQEISHALSAPEATQNSQRFAELSKEYSELKTIVDTFVEYQATETALESARLMAQNEPELRELAEEETRTLNARLPILEQALQLLLLPSDPNDQRNIFLEIRAGTGGDEAAIFAGDLFRMYSRYADTQGWQVEVVSSSHGEHGGYKEIISRIVGLGAYSKFRYESGTHRVQRVPATESQGRVHTSTCTVAILPEVDAIDDIKLNPQDLKVDTFRASGAGGQHINKTDSAIRITHLPSGLIVECQDERSQHKNRARALALLSARLLDQEQQKQQQEQAHTRRMQVGTGDRSERIRTYNFSQARMTDHRINLTLYKLNEILEGDLEQVILPLVHEHQAMQLAEMTRDGYD